MLKKRYSVYLNINSTNSNLEEQMRMVVCGVGIWWYSGISMLTKYSLIAYQNKSEHNTVPYGGKHSRPSKSDFLTKISIPNSHPGCM